MAVYLIKNIQANRQLQIQQKNQVNEQFNRGFMQGENPHETFFLVAIFNNSTFSIGNLDARIALV